MDSLIRPSPGRSRNMAAIRSRDTRTELYVRRAVHGAGFRYRLHNKMLPGKPDLVFPRLRAIVFVHGCFWHGHVCEVASRPKTNTSYWSPKIERNIARDRTSAKGLRRMGWKVFIIRECRLESGTRRVVSSLKRLQPVEGRAHD
ncbi:MAG: very short patch repair endonuclease [Dehalococcoidia bacterium]|nr:very short patch repair endonuclease [Dehalococcoidia bacterium]